MKMEKLTSKEEYVFFKVMRNQYNYFIIMLILITVAGFKLMTPIASPDAVLVQTMQSVGVMLTLVSIPFLIQYFDKQLSRIKEIDSLAQRLKRYQRLSMVRILLYSVVTIFNLSLFFLFKDLTFLLLSGMLVLSSVWAIPTPKRIQKVLYKEMD